MSSSLGQLGSSRVTVGFQVVDSGFAGLVARSRRLEMISSTSSQARFTLHWSPGTWGLVDKVGCEGGYVTLV